MVSTYTSVTMGREMIMARGKFLKGWAETGHQSTAQDHGPDPKTGARLLQCLCRRQTLTLGLGSCKNPD